MTIDREQIRRDANFWLDDLTLSREPHGSPLEPRADRLARHCLALLAELEQAEKVLADLSPSPDGGYGPDNGAAWKDGYLARMRELQQAERELVLLREELRIRESSQIPVIPEGATREMDRLEARLAKVPALVEAMASALTSIATGPLKDGYAYSVLEEALAEWERE